MSSAPKASLLRVYLSESESNLVDSSLEEAKNPFNWVVKRFVELHNESPNTAPAVSAVTALTELIKHSKANTMMELEMDLKKAVELLKTASNALSVSSGCELFAKFVSRISGDVPNFEECRKTLIARGEQYIIQSSTSRDRICKISDAFIRDGVTVLTHGFSRVVLAILLNAWSQRKRFSVIVTEARPDLIGFFTAKKLEEAKINVTIIPDAAVSYVMDRVDLVLVGAEGIVENGGIINKLGTYQMAIIASALKKPFYVAAESFKFMRVYPLNQRDIGGFKQHQDQDKSKSHFFQNCSLQDIKLENTKVESPANDYTPPALITLLFTELGILTPSAVSDELIKLYY